MKAYKTLAAVAALATGLAVASAAAAAVEIDFGYSLNGGAIVAFGPGAAVVPGGNANVTAGTVLAGYWQVNTLAATYATEPDLLASNTIDVRSAGSCAGCTLDLFVTLKNIPTTSLVNDKLFSSFSASAGAPGSSLTTLYDTGNGLFTGSSLQTLPYSGGGFGNGTNTVAHPGSPFSVTEVYHLTAFLTGGAAAANHTDHTNATIDLATDVPGVPEPATWAMMIAGFGGIGAVLRSRRRPAAATA
jgi:hypothetical protein